MISADTNLYIYAAQPSQGYKHSISVRVLSQLVLLRAPVGLQVVGEFQNSGRRKLGLVPDNLVKLGEYMLTSFAVFPSTPSAIRTAMSSEAVRRLQFWDAVLVASAAEAGCHTLLSEDMGHGEVYFGVRVLNPFSDNGEVSPAVSTLLDL